MRSSLPVYTCMHFYRNYEWEKLILRAFLSSFAAVRSNFIEISDISILNEDSAVFFFFFFFVCLFCLFLSGAGGGRGGVVCLSVFI